MNDSNEKWTHRLQEGLPTLGHEIEAKSHEIIDSLVSDMQIPPASLPVVRRMIHATADVQFGQTVRVHPDAVARGIEAIGEAKDIICDVHMLQAGITRTKSQVLCAIRDQQVIDWAAENQTTRSAAAMEYFADRLHGAIVAIGNAPTALWKILELADRRGIIPALVVGIPVGFVGAAESKQALLESDLCYITNIGPRGGSPIAAAAVNALAIESGRKK